MELRGTMKCPRCKCSMVYEKFFGPGEPFWGWRCVYCGEILDDLILENRAFWEASGTVQTTL